MIQLLKLLIALLDLYHLIGTKVAHHLCQDGSTGATKYTCDTVKALKFSLFY